VGDDRKIDELSQRLQRIDACLASIAQQLENLTKSRQRVAQEILFSQAAYLGDHRALTYLSSGQKIFVDTRCVDVGSHLLLGGVWEAHYTTAFLRLLKPGQVVLDIGANHGVYSLQAATRVAPNGHVYAFEPNPRFSSLMKDSIAVNGLASLITLVEKAVADREGEVTLVFEDRHPAQGRLRDAVQSASGNEPVKTCVVGAITLDRYFPDARVDVVKMDIEGAEGLALDGMAGLIERSRDLKIMMEFGSPTMSAFTRNAEYVTDFLGSRGFACWRISGDGSLIPTGWQALLANDDTIQNVIASRQGIA
jgi:FkbM family methyltransferase